MVQLCYQLGRRGQEGWRQLTKLELEELDRVQEEIYSIKLPQYREDSNKQQTQRSQKYSKESIIKQNTILTEIQNLPLTFL